MWIVAVAVRSIKSPRRGGKADTRTRVMRRDGMPQMMPCGYDNLLAAQTADHVADRR
jgi:hypothetical protein